MASGKGMYNLYPMTFWYSSNSLVLLPWDDSEEPTQLPSSVQKFNSILYLFLLPHSPTGVDLWGYSSVNFLHVPGNQTSQSQPVLWNPLYNLGSGSDIIRGSQDVSPSPLFLAPSVLSLISEHLMSLHPPAQKMQLRRCSEHLSTKGITRSLHFGSNISWMK